MNISSLSQWICINEIGHITIFDEEPESGPSYGWKALYVPSPERTSFELMEVCSCREPIVMTAPKFIKMVFVLLSNMYYDSKINRIRRNDTENDLYRHCLLLEHRKSQCLSSAIKDYVNVYAGGMVCPAVHAADMVRSCKKYNNSSYWLLSWQA